MKNRIKIEDYLGEELDVNKCIQEARLLCEDKIEHDQICLEIKQGVTWYTIGTYKNFSCTVGAQKSRKTFFGCMLMAPCVMKEPNGMYEGIRAHTFGRTNIFFDTEQAKYHAQSSNKRISVMSGNGGFTPANFEYYGLRKWNYMERLTIIEEILRRTHRPGLIIIDGIRDLIGSINDEIQSTELITKLMQWTDELDCHINVVIHLKKGDFASPRGWLGTEIQNKAESVIEVKKDDEFPARVSRVIPKDMRGVEFQEFSFEISEGIPVQVDSEKLDYLKKTEAPY